MWTLRWLYVSDAEIVTVSSSTPAVERQLCAAHVRHQRGIDHAWRRTMPAITSAAPAIAGTAFGDTNAATSMWLTPASVSASTRRDPVRDATPAPRAAGRRGDRRRGS